MGEGTRRERVSGWSGQSLSDHLEPMEALHVHECVNSEPLITSGLWRHLCVCGLLSVKGQPE